MEETCTKWQLFDSLPVPVFIINENGDCVFVNSAVEKYYGYSPQELIHLNLKEINIISNIEKTRQIIEYSFLTGQGSRIKTKHKTKYGKSLDVDIEWSILEVNGKKYLISLIKDISLYTTSASNNRKTMKKNIKQKLYQFVIENFNIEFLVLDKNFTVTYQSPGYTTGYAVNVVGRTIFEVYEEDIKNDPRLLEIKNLGKESPFLIIQNYNHLNQKNIHGTKIANIQCHYLNFNNEQKYLLVFNDYTERLYYKKGIEEFKELLENKNRLILLGETIAGIAHEINNPLTSIMANAQILCKKQNNTKEAERIFHESNRMAKIIKSLLSFSHHSPNVKNLINIKKEINDILPILSSKLTNEIVLNLELDEKLYIFGDTVEFGQIIINLVKNSIDALKNSTEKIIELKAKELEETIEISITDTGCGIPAEYIEKIFTPFFTTKSIGEGTGLGLSIVFYLVEKMQGRISVTSTKNAGTCFTLTLPKYKKSNYYTLTKENCLQNKKILIVDDEYILLETLKEIITEEALLVTIENDPIKGLQAILEEIHDVILLDMEMPILNGLEIYKTLRANDFDVNKIILMTESLSLEKVNRLAEEHKCKIIQKPFDLEQLQECLV